MVCAVAIGVRRAFVPLIQHALIPYEMTQSKNPRRSQAMVRDAVEMFIQMENWDGLAVIFAQLPSGMTFALADRFVVDGLCPPFDIHYHICFTKRPASMLGNALQEKLHMAIKQWMSIVNGSIHTTWGCFNSIYLGMDT